MAKPFERLLLISLFVAMVTITCWGVAIAGLTTSSSPTTATANSVWNLTVVWQDDDGIWPLYMPDTDTETIQPDPGGSILGERHTAASSPILETERDVDDIRPGIKLGIRWAGDLASTPPMTNDLLRMPYPAAADPSWTLPTGIPTIGFDANNFLQQVYIPRHTIRRTFTETNDGGTPEDPADDTTTETVQVWDCPPVIVCRESIVGNVGLSLSQSGAPYNDFEVASAQNVRCHLTTTETVTEGTGDPTVTVTQSCDPEPVWAGNPQTGLPPAPNVNVIVLNPWTGANCSAAGPAPEQAFPDAKRAFVTYSRITVSRVSTSQRPLPAATATYRLPIIIGLDGSAKIKINKGVFTFDANRTDVADADPRFPDRPGRNNPIIGVFEPGDTETNYFRPGSHSSRSGYDMITIDKELIPEDDESWVDGKIMNIVVSSWGVDAVYTDLEEHSDPKYPRRINYFRQPEWTPGVITRAWPGDATAYEVRPDVNPKTVGMKAVTGMFLPQIQSGTATDRTHVAPRDLDRVKTVLGVYALLSMDGTRFDSTHVIPANPIPAGGFVSAVYAVARQNGTVIDPRHVTPSDLASIFRVRHVYVGNGGTDYYDSANPFLPGENEIALNQDLPAGTNSVTIEYETYSLYDPENPELRFTDGDTRISLDNPLPEGSNSARIVYGVGTGLDGFNYYDPNNTMTAFQQGDEDLVLRSPLPEGVADVRILYGTDLTLETRGAIVDAGNVTTPDIWSVGSVKNAWAIREFEGLREDDTHVSPYDPLVMKDVFGVYPVLEMQDVTRIDDTHIGPPADDPATPAVNENHSFLGIRGAREVYAIDDQTGTPNPANRLRVAPADPNIIARIIGVFDNAQKTGTNYFDPENPEATWRTGDAEIALSTPLPDPAPATVYISYETINLITNPATAFDTGDENVAGDEQVTLDTPLPADPISIRLIYTSNANHYSRRNPVQPFQPGDMQITLNTPLPEGTIEAVVVYLEAMNRYNNITPWTYAGPDYNPAFVPGDTQIPLMVALPADAAGVLVEYSAHLFHPGYDPSNISWYDPDNPATIARRPFIPGLGDTVIRLNRIDPAVPLPARFTGPGALKLCVAYQSGAKVPMGTYTAGGVLDLAIPLPESPWRALGPMGTPPFVVANPVFYIDYRVLSNANGGGTYTVGRPSRGAVISHSLLPPEPTHGSNFDAPLPLIDGNGRFTAVCVGESPSTPAGPGASATITYRRQEPDSPQGVVWITGIGGKYGGRIPAYFRTGNPRDGATYKVAVSRGLNMSNPLQQPTLDLFEHSPTLVNRFIFNNFSKPMWYAPGLSARPDPIPIGSIGYMYNTEGDLDNYEAEAKEVNVRGSHGLVDLIDYGGGGNQDSLTCYPETFGGSWPQGADIDPLIIEPLEDANPAAPDDGSGSLQFVFRVRYNNGAGLPPLPWLPGTVDTWNNRTSGVVLYLDEQGTGDYRPHFMGLEHPEVAGSNVYMLRVMPHNAMGIYSDPESMPMNRGFSGQYDNTLYSSLGIGVYHYFFACSDDSLTFENGSFPFQNQSAAGRLEWGEQPNFQTRGSTGLDPTLPRSVTGYGEINRAAKRRYSSDGVSPFDASLFVDRPVRAPGLFEDALKEGIGFTYPWKASEHPRVTCELHMPSQDDLNVRYDDAKYGSGRFFGTLDMAGPNSGFYRCSNPSHPGTRTGGNPAVLAETCGSTAGTDNVFRIMYRQIDNKPPIYIRVMINNASEKTGTTAAHAYTGYTMYPRADQAQPYNYRTGVWYEYKTRLPAGPHTYYFQVYDGEHIARFPVRPDRYNYDLPGEPGYYVDWWTPTQSLHTERGTANYIDNDYIQGPYVNNRCTLTEASVSPGTGKEGQNYKYRVKYTDPDGQRIHSAFIYVETNNRGDVRKLSMTPETPIDPTKDNSALFKQGVYYILDTGTLKDFGLERGARRFYFEFTDDWGRQGDVNDLVKGETTRLPVSPGSWIPGPVVSGNLPPTLTEGSVASQDGTANAATVWTFRVTYRDLNNDPPSLLKVYTGELQPDGKTILWDDGHSMAPTDPANVVYVDGIEYYYQTRLGGVDSVVAGEPAPAPKQYFYAFEAFDGADWSTYNSSSDDELRSNASGAFILSDAQRLDGTHYKLTPVIAQQAVVNTTSQVTPEKAWDIISVRGVYLTEDLTGTSYYDPDAANPAFEPGDTKIMLTSALPTGRDRVWVKYEAQSPIVGPLPVELPAPVGVIPDAQIFENGALVPLPIDDQKNGWISLTDPTDRGEMMMKATAIFEGMASRKYVVPADARNIASVEGVYLHPDFSGTNYYDPAVLETPISQTGTPVASDATRKTVKASDPGRVAKVLGVYDNPDMLGTNYFMGVGYPTTVKWQPAIIVGSATAWATDPNDIVSIKGVYPTMDTTGQSLYREDRASAQLGTPGDLVVQPSNSAAIVQIMGIFLSRDVNGDPVEPNYYDPAAATPPFATGDPFVTTTTPLPGGTVSVQIQYRTATDQVAWQSGATYFGYVTPNDPLPIGLLTGVHLTHSLDAQGKPVGTGRSYYDPAVANPPYVAGSPVIKLTTPISRSTLGANGTVSILYTNRGFGFGPDGEYIALTKELDLNVLNPTAFIAYYPVGTLDAGGQIALSTALPVGVNEVHIKIHTPTFNCGDSIIPLTTDLPEVLHSGDPTNRTVYVKYSDIRFTHQLRGSAHQPASGFLTWLPGTTHYSPDGWEVGSSVTQWMEATVASKRAVVPANPGAISTVTGVFLEQDLTGTDYYEDTFTPFLSGSTFVYLGSDLPAGTTKVYIAYNGKSVSIKGNRDDVTAGVIGVWLNAQRDATNYLDPRRTARIDDNPLHVRLTTPAPLGTPYLWARYYQKGDYHIDRWNRQIVFLEGRDAGSSIKASYFFGTKMAQTLGPNTAPELSKGKVTPLTGSRTTQYVYTVTYRDLDGPNGQVPAYVRVYIDGNSFDMTPENTGGTPAFREGAVYTFTPPDGLTGGSHKYHFEASDGAALAWFDANGAHQGLVGSTVESVKDLDGPWVNNPPTLALGKADPNPATGGIGTSQSIDYTVVFTDLDNNPPYFHDPVADLDKDGKPVGADLSGSPRLWVDSGANDQSFSGVVASLQADPLDPTKKRTIVAEGTPGWQVDQFAGKLMQITTGTLEGRVYLVQSNTANTLVIATDDLEKDGVVAGAQLRVNGLLMYKANPAQQDFTAGVTYKITVPKLAVGTHKFHFTARSREVKPQWLRAQMIADGLNPLPYSSEVRNPVTGDIDGPTVVSTPPTGNSKPEIANTADTSLYRGPVIHSARVDSAGVVNVSDFFMQIRQALGVYVNANEAQLATGTNYHDPDSTTTPYVQGQTTVKLSPNLPAFAAGQSLVQLGVVANSRLQVRPDDYTTIGGVTGVFDNPQLTGDNYYAAGTYQAGQQTIKLRADKPLPAAVKTVYVQYTLKSGVTWPKVYLRYFAFASAESIYLANEPLTFRINYKDVDNDPPTYHDSVAGFIRVVFNDSGRSAQMLPLKAPVLDYKVNVPFSVTLTDVPEGSHKYHFEASDGYYSVRWPEGTPGNPAANDYTIRVNYKPVILTGTVDHTSGATTFTFTAKYQDRDGTAPYADSFILRLTKDDGTIERTYLMIRSPLETAPNYAVGVNYTVVVDAKDAAKPLTPGTYHTVFEASDGMQDADPLVGPDIKVRDTNFKPVIKSYLVTPNAGKTGMTFTYSGFYYDQDNDAPVALSGGARLEGLTLIVDQGSSTEQRLLMTRVNPGSTPDYTTTNGVEYTASLSGKRLGPGRHTYTVIASDGTDSSVFASGLASYKVGPVLLIPYFSLEASTRDGAAVTDTTVVGQEILLSGNMFFPYNNESGRPGSISNLTIQVTKPDGTALALNARVENIQEDDQTPHENWVGDIIVNYGGFVDPVLATGSSITLTASGLWSISAAWPGDSQWDMAETDTNMDGQNDAILVTVGGPSRTVAVADPTRPEFSGPVVDMITPPMMIGSSDPGGIFGFDRALEMQVVRWSPTAKAYLRYGVGGIFPPLAPGDAVWIKPKTTYAAAEPLGARALQRGTVVDLDTVRIPKDMADQTVYVAGVYTTANLSGTNYFRPQVANPPYRLGDTLIELTANLPLGATDVYVDYVKWPLSGVDEGWIALDNPTVARAIEGGEPRYYHAWYRLVRVLAQAYQNQTDTLGNVVLDPATRLPLLKPLRIQLKTGWNQVGSIFLNWKKGSQAGAATGSRTVTPTQPDKVGKVLGVYTTAALTGTNYYVPGTATQPYRHGDTVINLTSALPAGVTTVYIKHEVYPREDIGLPMSEVSVLYLGERKTLSEAKAAGWVNDYAWRYDAALHEYVQVSATAPRAERALKAWSGYWFKAMVDCELELNPNTSFNGAVAGLTTGPAAEDRSPQRLDMPPPAPE